MFIIIISEHISKGLYICELTCMCLPQNVWTSKHCILLKHLYVCHGDAVAGFITCLRRKC